MAAGTAGDAAGEPTGRAITSAPGRTRWTPSTTMDSPGLQALQHFHLAVLALTDVDDAALDLIVLHRIDELAKAFADDGLLRNQHRIVLRGHLEARRTGTCRA